MSVHDRLAELGFTVAQDRRDGSRQYALRAHTYLVYWATVYPDATAELTWEFSLGEYLRAKGLSVSGQDELSLLLFPGSEVRGNADDEWPVRALGEAQELLESIDFLRAT